MTKLFTEINSKTRDGKDTKILVRTLDIVGIKEMPLETIKLYDEYGNLVSETEPTEKDFQVLVCDNFHHVEKVHINETEYLRLLDILSQIE